MSTRLNKLLAERGLGARRKCDELIRSGVVQVNGRVVTEPGTAVEPGRDRVEVRGRRIPPPQRLAYYVLHKPVGVISTLSDPEGRPTVRELLPPGARLFPVGRLDADTSGVLLLTNDGELAHHLMHPRYGVSKSYRVHADRAPGTAMLQRLADGIEFEPGVVSAPARVRVLDHTPGDSVLEISIHEGRYRQVRRMCEAAGLTVHRLHRWAYGPLQLRDLPRGMWRELSDAEVAALRAASARPRGGARVPHRPRGLRRGRDAGPPPDRRERAPSRYRGERSPGVGAPAPAARAGGGRGPAGPRDRGGRAARGAWRRGSESGPRREWAGSRPRPAAERRSRQFRGREGGGAPWSDATRPPRRGASGPRRPDATRPPRRGASGPRRPDATRPPRRGASGPRRPDAMSPARRGGPRRPDATSPPGRGASGPRRFRDGGRSEDRRRPTGPPRKGRFGRPAASRSAEAPGGGFPGRPSRPFRGRAERGESTRRPGSGGTGPGGRRGRGPRRRFPGEP